MKTAPKLQKSPVLPLPEGVIEHHLETLGQWTRQWLEQDRVPPVLLLTGIEGVGKREVGYYLAQWLLCERAGFRKDAAPTGMEDENGSLFGGDLLGRSGQETKPAVPATPANRPCGECRSCHKALQATWVDFREIDSPAEDGSDEGGARRLKIDLFRELKQTAGFGSHEGGYRIFLVADAERMTLQAANSLLKLLEEPPPGWVFILTASDSSLLLPTVVSRCQRIRLKPFSNSILASVLAEAGVPAERRSLSVELAQGSWKKALALAEDQHRERREAVLRFFANPPENLGTVLDWSSTGADMLALLVDLLEPCQLELLRWSYEAASLQDPHRFDDFLTSHLKYVAMNLRSIEQARKFWLQRAERLARARQEITLPLNKKLLAQEILLPYLLS